MAKYKINDKIKSKRWVGSDVFEISDIQGGQYCGQYVSDYVSYPYSYDIISVDNNENYYCINRTEVIKECDCGVKFCSGGEHSDWCKTLEKDMNNEYIQPLC